MHALEVWSIWILGWAAEMTYNRNVKCEEHMLTRGYMNPMQDHLNDQ